jgi:Uma2 family endonuclease
MKPTETAPSFEQEFPYGWRYVKRALPDGGETLEQVALSLEDVLHPKEGDVIPENTFHESDCRYLADVFATRLLSPPCSLVTRDLLIDWGVAGIRNHSPDVAVFVGLSREPGQTGVLELAALGGRCELIVEVVSPRTRENDVVAKFRHYHQLGIPLYALIDQEVEDGPRWVRAYCWTAAQYAEIVADAQGRLMLAPLGLLLGMREGHAVCFDARTGQEMGDYARIVRALEEADCRFEQQNQAIEDQIEATRQAERRAKDAIDKAELAQQEADRQQQDADRQRRAREEAENQRQFMQQEADKQRLAHEAAQQQAAQCIRDLEDLVRRLQQAAGGGETPNATT